MAQARGFLGSSIGRKVVMAVTGAILLGFVIAHLVGNLQIYLPNGREAMNAYGLFLRQVLHGWALWLVRGILLVSVLLHIWAAISLTLDSRAARGVGYRERQWTESTYASRTMRWSGVIIFLFVIYHLMHFTFGNAHPSFIEGDVYHNFIEGFKSVPVSLFYILAMIFLGLHLRHGIWSMCQTLGVSHPKYMRIARAAAWAFAAVIVIGNVSFPLAVLAGVLK
ncbi:MAG: succinate dehydrogenase cytochrome b subunit [Thermoanaerobaculia bacterium]